MNLGRLQVAVGDADKDNATGTSCSAIIVNADDWGFDANTTDRSLECVSYGAISSVSAMVFMEDSERAAHLALQHHVDAGLHLNLSTRFTALRCPVRLIEHQQKLSRFLRAHRLAPILFHPGLINSFDYVVKGQLEEFDRLYGSPASRVDGHHHMHLCANVVFQNLLPAGTVIRRNFSFGPDERGYLNRSYRYWQDRRLARRHRMTDYFFALPPIKPRNRLNRILDLASRFSVELETHPANADEYTFLIDRELMNCGENIIVAKGYGLRASNWTIAGR